MSEGWPNFFHGYSFKGGKMKGFLRCWVKSLEVLICCILYIEYNFLVSNFLFVHWDLDHCVPCLNQKWSEFKLENITLKLQRAEIIKKSRRNEYRNETYEKDDKIFVEFEIDSCCERRPFLLSRDFAFARPSGQMTEPCQVSVLNFLVTICCEVCHFTLGMKQMVEIKHYLTWASFSAVNLLTSLMFSNSHQGIIYRVERSTRVVVEFGKDFLLQHHSTRKYDVSFSFNRVCLKRAHHAIEAASDPLFKSFLFPDGVSKKIFPISTPLHFCNHKLDVYQSSAVREILSFQGPPPYIVEGPLCLNKFSELSRTGLVIQEAVLQIYQSSSKLRILICAPINRTCDLLMQSLNNDIPKSDMFRANAAFREIDGVPIDILPSCAYKGECFTCPSLQELRKFRVILSTFVSSFRLRNEGIAAGHFSHIFLVDASSAIEPEAMVPLANLASEETAVIVTGAPGNHSRWVRSNIARKNGLMTSYFERLRHSKPYRSLLPKFITQLADPQKESVGDYSYASVSYD